MLLALSSGLLLGLSCGLAPGPLLALVLTQTLRHGPKEGCKVALAPLLTDAPMIAIALLVATEVSRWHQAMAVLSLVGGFFVLYLAYDTFRPPNLDPDSVEVRPRSWLKGILVNALNPQPWVFWMTVGAASMAKATAAGWPAVATFLGAFYFSLVGTKIALALISGQFRQLLSSRIYRAILVVFSLLLVIFAVLLIRAGIVQLAGR